jgi:hypothetical protein
LGTGAFERFADKAKDISNDCLAHVLDFLDDDKVLKIAVSDIIFKKEDQLPRKRIELKSYALRRKGLYAFIDQDGEICYIGQGGEGASTPLKARICQELKLWNKTSDGSNGATFSKNLQEIDRVQFGTRDAFWKRIASWKMRILHADDFSVSTEFIEAFLIRLFDPRLNKRARVIEATLEDVLELEDVSE